MKTTIPDKLYKFSWDWALYKAVRNDGSLPISTEYEQDGYRFLIANNGYTYYAKMGEWGGVLRHLTSLSGLKLGHPFEAPYTLTNDFNAPRNYKGKKHEGLDFDVIDPVANSTQPVIAMYEGKAYVNHTVDGYGKYVRIESSYNGEKFFLWYGHLDKTFVTTGQEIKIGQRIGEIGNTGNSTGEHLHLTLSVPSLGDNGYVVNGAVDPTAFLPERPYIQRVIKPKAPEPTMVDLLPYLIGDGKCYELKRPDGGVELIQYRTVSDNEFMYVKGLWQGFHEDLAFDDEWIYRGLDTSENMDGYYIQYHKGVIFNGRRYAKWVRRFQYIGGEPVYPEPHIVSHHNKSDGKIRNNGSLKGTNVNRVRIYEFATNWKSVYGIVVDDVLFLDGVDAIGKTTERYGYGKGIGLVYHRHYNHAEFGTQSSEISKKFPEHEDILVNRIPYHPPVL